MKYNRLFIRDSNYKLIATSVIDSLTNAISHIDNLAKRKSSNFVVVLQPSELEFVYNEETLFWQ